MGIWAGIVAICKTIGEAIGLSRYWLNPKERQRRRKQKFLNEYMDLEAERDKWFKKGAQEGFSREIDLKIAQLEKQMNDLKRKIKAIQ